MRYQYQLPDGNMGEFESDRELSQAELVSTVAMLTSGGGAAAPKPPPPAEAPEGPSFGRQIQGIAIEMTGGVATQMAAGAASIPTLGTAWFPITFSGGYGASVLAQKRENPEGDISQGRAIASGLLNMVPGAPGFKAVVRGGKVALSEGAKQLMEAVARREGRKAVVRRSAAGVGYATGYELTKDVIGVALDEEGAELPSAGKLVTTGIFGAAFGGGLEVASQKMSPIVRDAFTKLWPRLKGKSEVEVGRALDKMIAAGDEDALVLLRAAQQQSDAIRMQRQKELEEVFTPVLDRLDAQEIVLKQKARAERAANRNANLAARVQAEARDPAVRAREEALQAVFPAEPPPMDVASKLDMDSPVMRIKELAATGRPFQALRELPLDDQVAINRHFRPTSEATRKVEAKMLQEELLANQMPATQPRISLEDLPSTSAVLEKMGWEPRMRQRVADDLAMGFTARGGGIDLTNGLIGSMVGAMFAPEDSRMEGAMGGFVTGMTLRTASKSKLVEQVGAKVKRLLPNVIPSMFVGRPVSEAIHLSKGRVAAINDQAGKIRDSVSKWVANQPDPDAAIKLLDDYNRGVVLPSALPSEIRYQVKALAEFRDEAQNELLNSVPNLSETNKALIRNSRGQYLTREYRIHSDKSYKPSPEASKALFTKLTLSKSKGGAGKTHAEANAFMQELANPEEFQNMALGRGSSHRGILLHRQNLSKEIRDYLGEILDPLEQMYGTVNKLTRLNAEAAKEQSIIMHGLSGGWIKEGAVPEMKPFNSRYGFGDFSIDEDALKALQQLEGKGISLENQPLGVKMLAGLNTTGNALAKFAAVPMNSASYMVQVYGNFSLMLSTPGVSWSSVKQGLKFAWENTGVPFAVAKGGTKPDFPAIFKELNTLKKYDILDQNVTMSDIRSGFSWLENTMGNLTAPFKAVGRKISTAYQLADNASRAIVFYSNRDNLQKIGTGLTGEALDRAAASVTNLTFPNYSRINDSIKALSKFGAANNFVAFNAELVRTSFNSVSLGASMIRRGRETGNKAMVQEGWRRAMVPPTLAALGVAGTALHNSINDVPKERGDAIKEALIPEYNERDMLLLEMTNDDKSFRYAQPSYLLPHAIVGDIASAFVDGGGGYDGLVNAMGKTWDSFGGEGTIFHRALFATILNSKPDGGGKVSVEGNPLELGAYFLEKGFPVGVVREYNLLRDALSETTRVGGRELTVAQLGERMAGLRVYQYNVEEAAIQKAKPIVQFFNDARGDYRRDVERNVTPKDREESYVRNSGRYQRAYEQTRTRVESLRRVGLETEQIARVLREAGMGQQEILMGLEGTFVPMPRDIPTPSRDVYESQIVGLSQNDAAAAITRIAKTQPELALQLRDYYRADAKSKYLGLTPEETILNRLSVSTGQRGRYLAEKVRGMTREQRETYLNDLAKRGLVNQKVNQDILRELYTQQ
jgi:hypothetical protein